MTPQELTDRLSKLSGELQRQCAVIIAETATEYFKGSFRRKEWNGRPWRRTLKHTGSTLIESGNLMNSIRPAEVSQNRVVISAGSEKVPYARVHNEGGLQYVRPHHRASRKGKRHQVRGYAYRAWRRQFMGYSPQLMDIIEKRITRHLSIFNPKP